MDKWMNEWLVLPWAPKKASVCYVKLGMGQSRATSQMFWKWSQYTKWIYKPWLSNFEHLIKLSLRNWTSACFLCGLQRGRGKDWYSLCFSHLSAGSKALVGPPQLPGHLLWPTQPCVSADDENPGHECLEMSLSSACPAGPCWLHPRLVMKPGPPGGSGCPVAMGELSAQCYLGKVILFSNTGTGLLLMAMLLISLRKQIALPSGGHFWVAASCHPAAPAAESALGPCVLPITQARSLRDLTLYLLPPDPASAHRYPHHTCINSDPILSLLKDGVMSNFMCQLG